MLIEKRELERYISSLTKTGLKQFITQIMLHPSSRRYFAKLIREYNDLIIFPVDKEVRINLETFGGLNYEDSKNNNYR